MRYVRRIDTIQDYDEAIFVLINSLSDIKIIEEKYPNIDIIYRLFLTSIDEHLVELISSLPYKIEIIYNPSIIQESELSILKKYNEETNNKIYLYYDIGNRTLNRDLLIYYVNTYNLITLMKSKNNKDYCEWLEEMMGYVPSKQTHKLSLQQK